MTSRADAAGVGPFLGVASALLLLGAGAATWVTEPVARSVGDIALVERRVTTGWELAPLAVVAALAGVVCSVGLLATRGPARRTIALLLAAVGVAAVLTVGAGLARLRALDGAVAAAPWLAAAGAGGVLVAGLVGFSRPGRRLPARYDVDASPADAEWRLASDPDAGTRARPTRDPSTSDASPGTAGEREQP